MKLPNFIIKHDTTLYVLIEDMGPWDKYPTITNAPEEVVKCVVANGLDERQLFYIDSSGDTDELKVKDGKFDGFSSGFNIKEKE